MYVRIYVIDNYIFLKLSDKVCVHCVGGNSFHKLKCEKGMLNPSIFVQMLVKFFYVHMSCDVVELTETLD